MKKLTLITLLLTCASLNAQVYSYVDSNGNTIYTDNPPEHQQTRTLDIELPPAKQAAVASNIDSDSEQGVKTVRLTPDTLPDSASNNSNPITTASPPAFTVTEVVKSYKLEITAPTNQEVIRNTDGQLTITVESEPALASGHKYRFVIDGKNISESTSPSYIMAGLERGEHKIIIEVIDANEHTLSKSKEHLFFIKQTTLADKRRVRPCKFKEYGVRPECPLKDRPKPEPRPLPIKITDALGLTKPCDLTDYGVRKDCPIEKKPKKSND